MKKEDRIDWGSLFFGGNGTLAAATWIGVPVGIISCLFLESWRPFWPILSVVTCGWTLTFYTKEVERVRRNKERTQREYEEKQNQIAWKAQEIVSASQNIANRLNNYIQYAENCLDQAVVEFRERAFAPFWDAVESAINNLGYFDQSIREIVANSKQHEESIVQLDNKRSFFSVSITNLPNARNTSERMRKIVRQAQKDFQFATIYEQKKTNRILVAGFGSLNNAINNMTYRIEDSISSLSNVITLSFEDQNELLGERLGEIKDSIETEGKQRRDHEEKEREMLENLQRRRLR